VLVNPITATNTTAMSLISTGGSAHHTPSPLRVFMSAYPAPPARSTPSHRRHWGQSDVFAAMALQATHPPVLTTGHAMVGTKGQSLAVGDITQLTATHNGSIIACATITDPIVQQRVLAGELNAVSIGIGMTPDGQSYLAEITLDPRSLVEHKSTFVHIADPVGMWQSSLTLGSPCLARTLDTISRAVSPLAMDPASPPPSTASPNAPAAVATATATSTPAHSAKPIPDRDPVTGKFLPSGTKHQPEHTETANQQPSPQTIIENIKQIQALIPDNEQHIGDALNDHIQTLFSAMSQTNVRLTTQIQELQEAKTKYEAELKAHQAREEEQKKETAKQEMRRIALDYIRDEPDEQLTAWLNADRTANSYKEATQALSELVMYRARTQGAQPAKRAKQSETYQAAAQAIHNAANATAYSERVATGRAASDAQARDAKAAADTRSLLGLLTSVKQNGLSPHMQAYLKPAAF
jgi:hypothetical protein